MKLKKWINKLFGEREEHESPSPDQLHAITDITLMLQMRREGQTLEQIGSYFGGSKQAVAQKLDRLLPPSPYKKLTRKQKKFAKAMAQGETATDAALISHNCDSRESAKAMGYQLAHRDDIKLAVAEIMQAHGLSKTHRVKRLKDHVDNQDPSISLKGLDQSWRLDGSYQDRLEVQAVPYDALTEHAEEVKKKLAALGVKVIEDDIIDIESTETKSGEDQGDSGNDT